MNLNLNRPKIVQLTVWPLAEAPVLGRRFCLEREVPAVLEPDEEPVELGHGFWLAAAVVVCSDRHFGLGPGLP